MPPAAVFPFPPAGREQITAFGYLTLNILRSSPRRHRGERTTTIPMKTPPLPVGFAVDGCTILCESGESVPCKIGEMCYNESNQKTEGDTGMTDQELLKAIREITREEVRAITREEVRAITREEVRAITREEIQESEKRIMAATKKEIQESEARIKKETILLMDAEFGPKFNLLAENQDIIIERLDKLERKVDGLEDKVLEHDFRLKIIK